ncbi:MAG TPA: carboxylating nicotinate-nucleotide diphosphorylase [Gemmatimonadales bacterium]|nr:carboxylating nicotinate-nucleotide diphosphorylase [Gemmatimonadales bacterium]
MRSRTDIERVAAMALAEDGETDLTTMLTVAAGVTAVGRLEFRSSGLLAGTAYANAVLEACGCAVEWKLSEGQSASAGSVVGSVSGELRRILRAERPVLNILQRASGIATATRAFVEAVAGTRCAILHTRKTAPGLRGLDVAAVIAGGGRSHRLDLAHEVMVKDNHWQALTRGGNTLEQALESAKRSGVTARYVEVESEEQLKQACAAGATRLLIDNQSPDTVRSWGQLARQRSPGIEIEATGGITLQNVRAYALAGADFISVGALTHSVRAADISLEVVL